MPKGDWPRPHNRKRFETNFEAIFGKHEIKTWDPEAEDNDVENPEQAEEGTGDTGGPSVNPN